MKKVDYFAEVGTGTVRLFAIAGMGLATVSFTALHLMAAFLLIGGHAPAKVRGPLWACLVLFGLLMAASGWLMWRLLRQVRSASGLTMMPLWFIEAFGSLLLAGIVVTAWLGHGPWLMVEGAVVAIAMITVRRRLRRRIAADDGGGVASANLEAG